ncbi:hypothetical protein [Streptomyces sp. NPDC090080]|uniref:hypothetical protein n=1 Tax=Streptomyces sp. NPDC090080 TaxID=3365939 RepID=UPI0037FCDE95
MAAIFDVSHIRELGNQWITVGENLWEYLEVMHGSVQAMAGGWVSKAGRAAQLVWNGNGQHNVWQAVWQAGWVAQELGKAINDYADQMQTALDDIQRSYLIEALTAVFGAVLGIASFGIGSILGRIAEMVATVTESLVSAMASIANLAGVLGRVASFVTQGISSAALQLATDVVAQLTAEGVTGAPVSINWSGEALSLPWAVLPMTFGGGKGTEGVHAAAPEVKPLVDTPHIEFSAPPVPSVSEGGSLPHGSSASVDFAVPHLEIPSSASLTESVTQANHGPVPRLDLATPVIDTPRSGAGIPGKNAPAAGVVHPAESGFAETPVVTRPGSPVPGVAGGDHAGAVRSGDPAVYTNPPAMTFHTTRDADPATPRTPDAPAPARAALEPQPGITGGGHAEALPPSAIPHDTPVAARGGAGDGTDGLALAAAGRSVPPVGGGGRESDAVASGVPRSGTHEEAGLTIATSRAGGPDVARGGAGGDVGPVRTATDGGVGRDVAASVRASGGSHEMPARAGSDSRAEGGAEGVGSRPGADTTVRTGSPEGGVARRADGGPQTSRDAAGGGADRTGNDRSAMTTVPSKARQGSAAEAPEGHTAARDETAGSQSSAIKKAESTARTTEAPASSASASSAAAHHDVGSASPAGGDRPAPGGAPGREPVREAAVPSHRDGAPQPADSGAGHHHVPDRSPADAARLEEQWNAFKQEHNERTLLQAEAEAKVDSRDLDAVWTAAYDKWAKMEDPGFAFGGREATDAWRNWRTDISRALQEEIRAGRQINAEVFERIMGHAETNAFKYFIKEDRARDFTAKVHEQIAAYKEHPFGYGEELPSLDNVSVPRLYDPELKLYVMDNSKQLGYPKGGINDPRYEPGKTAPEDHFRHDMKNDFNPLEQWTFGKSAEFDRTFDGYLRDAGAQGPLPLSVRHRIEEHLEPSSVRGDLDKLATREREVRLAWQEHFDTLTSAEPHTGTRPGTAPDGVRAEAADGGAVNQRLSADDLEALSGQVLSQVERDVRFELRDAYDRYFAGVTREPQAHDATPDAADDGLAPWTRPAEDIHVRIEKEDFVQAQVKEEGKFAEGLSVVKSLSAEARQRVLGEYSRAVRKRADQYFTEWNRGDRNPADAAKWAALRDELRQSLPERVRYEGTVQGVVTEAARDFHEALGHPDSSEAFHLADTTRERLGGEVEAERVRTHMETFAPDHDSRAWSAHHSNHENAFASQVEQLRSQPRPGDIAGPGSRPASGGDETAAAGGQDGRPSGSDGPAPSAAVKDAGTPPPGEAVPSSDHALQEQLHVPSERSAAAMGPDVTVRTRPDAASAVAGHGPAEGLRGTLHMDRALADAVAERLRQEGHAVASDAEILGAHEQVLAGDAEFGELPTRVQAQQVAGRLVETRTGLHVAELHAAVRQQLDESSFAPVSVREVRAQFELVRASQPGFAALAVGQQADALVIAMSESLARQVRLSSGMHVDVAAVRRIDGELGRELGDGFWRLSASDRAGHVAERLLEDQALRGAADVVEGRAAHARGQGPVRRVLAQLVEERGAEFAALPVEARVAEVTAGVQAERQLVHVVNLLRGGHDFVRSSDVLAVHEDLVRARGVSYQRLPVAERARAVLEGLAAEHRLDQVHAVAETALRRQGADTISRATTERIFQTLAHGREDAFRLRGPGHIGRGVARWALMERGLIQEFESLREGTSAAQRLAALSAHEKLVRERGEPFIRLSLAERARIVLERVEAERPFPGTANTPAQEDASGSARGTEDSGGAVLPPTAELSVLAPLVRERVARHGQSAVSDAELGTAYERLLANDVRSAGASVGAQAIVLSEQLIRDRMSVRLPALHEAVRERLDGLAYAPVSVREVRAQFELLLPLRSGFADLGVAEQADALVIAMSESLARQVRLSSGMHVDVAAVRRIDGELGRELGDGFWRLSASDRAGHVAERLLEDQALRGAADVVEGRAAHARGQGPVRRVLAQLVEERGAEFAALPVEARVAEVTAGVQAERQLVHVVNLLRGGHDFVRSSDVLAVHEDLVRVRGVSYQRLPVAERARAVLEGLAAEHRLDQVHAVAETALRRQGADTISRATTERIIENLVFREGDAFRLKDIPEQGGAVIAWARMERQLIRAVTSLPGGRSLVRRVPVAQAHDRLVRERGESFLELSLAERARIVVERGAADRPVRTAADAPAHAGASASAHEVRGSGVVTPPPTAELSVLAPQVRTRMAQFGQAAVSDAELEAAYERALTESGPGVQETVLVERLIRDRMARQLPVLHTAVAERLDGLGFAPVPAREVRAQFELKLLTRPGFADLEVGEQADALVAAMSDSLARQVRLVNGGLRVDVATVRRLDSELARERGDDYAQLEIAFRIRHLTERLHEERKAAVTPRAVPERPAVGDEAVQFGEQHPEAAAPAREVADADVGAVLPETLRMEFDLPSEVNGRLYGIHGRDLVTAEQAFDAYRAVETLHGEAFTGLGRDAQYDTVAQYIAGVEVTLPKVAGSLEEAPASDTTARLRLAVDAVLQQWGAKTAETVDVRRVRDELVEGLGEFFQDVSVHELALDVAARTGGDRKTVETDTETRHSPPDDALFSFVSERLRNLPAERKITKKDVVEAHRHLEGSAAFKRQDPRARLERVVEHMAGLDSRMRGGAAVEPSMTVPGHADVQENEGAIASGSTSASRGPAAVRDTSTLLPVGRSLDQERPPLVDRTLPPPAALTETSSVRFPDGRKMPPYMGGQRHAAPAVREWLRGLPEEVREQSFAFGHSMRELRGVDAAVQEIVRQLSSYPGVRPKRDGARVVEQLLAALGRDPLGPFADGVRIPYKSVNGRALVLKLRLRPYGEWKQVTHGGSPVKVDTMRQSVGTSGRVVSNGTSWGLTPQLPLGVWTAVVNWFARVSLQVKFGTQTDHELNTKTEVTDTTQTKSGRPYLDDVRYDFSVVSKDGHAVDVRGKPLRQGAVQAEPEFGFAVRRGLHVVVDDSLTAPPAQREDAPPATLNMGAQEIRLKAVEAYGPIPEHVHEWAIRESGVHANSAAAHTIRDLFSSARFQQLSQALEVGEVVSPLLYGGPRGTEALGFFSVRVESREAVLVSVADDAELGQTVQSHVPNGRTFTSSRQVEVSAGAGPAFQIAPGVTGDPGARVNAGLTVGGGAKSAHKTASDIDASHKVGVQAKEVVTGLYWVRKEVTVTAPYPRKAPIPKPAKDSSGHRKLIKNPPLPTDWMNRPAQQTFSTWALERVPVDQLTPPDSAVNVTAEAGRTAPAAPPYLTENDPPTLGMSRVDAITFEGGLAARNVDGRTVTFLDHFREALLRAIHERYPKLVAMDDQLSPDHPQWESSDQYETALHNTLQVHAHLNYHRVTTRLNELMTTGDAIVLTRSRRFMRGFVEVRLGAGLTERGFVRGREHSWVSHSMPVGKSVSGQQSAGHTARVNVDASVSLRSAALDMGGGPIQTGTLSVGGKIAASWDTANGYGVAGVYEPKAHGTGAVNQWSYKFRLHAGIAGYDQLRHRHLIPGANTGAFVFSRPPAPLLDHSDQPGLESSQATPVPGMGEVLLSVPIEHTPVGPQAADTTVPRGEEMTAADARALVMGTLARRGRSGLSDYPYQLVAVTGSRDLNALYETVLRGATSNYWRYREPGAAPREAALRRVEATPLSGGFGETSTAAGLNMWGVISTNLILPRQTRIVHRTSIDGLPTALTPPVDLRSGAALGAFAYATGQQGRTVGGSLGIQLAGTRSVDLGPVVSQTLNLMPLAVDVTGTSVVLRALYEELSVTNHGHHYLVAFPVAHEVVAASGRLGDRMHDLPLVPASLDGVAGRRVTIPRGLYGHMREADAHLYGVVTDHLGAVPRYDKGRKWQPLLTGLPFSNWAVNSLDTAEPLRRFQQDLRRLGLPTEDREQLQRLVSEHIMLALGKEPTGRGATMPARIGRWGSRTLELWLGRRKVLLTIALKPVEGAEGTFNGLGRGAGMTQYREVRQTVERAHSTTSGAMMGIAISVAAKTADSVAGSVNSAYSQSDSSRQTITSARSEGVVSASVMSMEGPYAEYTTQYELVLDIRVGDGDGKPRTSESRIPVGGLTERFPLSVMRPRTEPSQREPLITEVPEAAAVRRPDPEVAAAVRERTWQFGGAARFARMPTTGVLVTGVVGRDNVEKAINLAVGAAYHPALPLPQQGAVDDAALLARALDTPLTRPGSGAAQALAMSVSHQALTGFYGNTVTREGYRTAVSTRTTFGGADAQIVVLSRPDFSRGRVLSVADGVRFNAYEQKVTTAGSSFTRAGGVERAADVGPAVAMGAAGSSQLGAGPAAQVSDSVTANLSTQNQASATVNSDTGGRWLLVSVPATFMVEASVRHHVKESKPLRAARGVFGPVRRESQVLQTETVLLMWMSGEEAARVGLGLPGPVADAWTSVDELQKQFIEADTAYWELRRDTDGVALSTRLRELDDRLADVTARAERDVQGAADALAHLREAEPAHEGWDAELAPQLDEAAARLRQAQLQASARVVAARGERDAARASLDGTRAQLEILERSAEEIVGRLADARQHADWLTRLHGESAERRNERDGIAESSGEQAPVTAPKDHQNDDAAGWSFDTTTDPDTLAATLPDGSRRVYDLRTPAGDGNRFYAAVREAGGFRRVSPQELARKVARTGPLRSRGDLPLDPRARFNVTDLERAFPGVFKADQRLPGQIENRGGRLPKHLFTTLSGDPEQRAALFALHLRTAHSWDARIEAVAASLVVQHIPRALIIVDESGSHEHYSEAGSGHVSDRPPVIVQRQGDTYLAAVPRQSEPSEQLSEVQLGKRPQREVTADRDADTWDSTGDAHDEGPADLISALAEAAQAEPSLRGFQPADVLTAFTIWRSTAAPLMGGDAAAEAARAEMYRDLARVTQELVTHGEAAARRAVSERAMSTGSMKGGMRPSRILGQGSTSRAPVVRPLPAGADGLADALAGGTRPVQLSVRAVRHTRRFRAADLGLDGNLLAAMEDSAQTAAARTDLLEEANRRVMDSLGHFQATDNNEVFIDTDGSHLVAWMTVAQEMATAFRHGINVSFAKDAAPVRICPKEQD